MHNTALLLPLMPFQRLANIDPHHHHQVWRSYAEQKSVTKTEKGVCATASDKGALLFNMSSESSGHKGSALRQDRNTLPVHNAF